MCQGDGGGKKSSSIGNGSFISDDQLAFHFRMDVTAENIAHKFKDPCLVGLKGYKDGFARLNTLGNIYAICFQIKSVCHISAAPGLPWRL